LGWLLRIFDIGILLRILGIDHHPDMLMFWLFLRGIDVLVWNWRASDLACLVISWKLISHRCNCSRLRYLGDLIFFLILFILDDFSIRRLCKNIILNLLLLWNWLSIYIILLRS
jgi:hypothetical protein